MREKKLHASGTEKLHASGTVRLAARIVWRHKGRMLFFASCIAVGIAFLFTVGNLTATISEEVASRAREMLTADVEISAYRPFSKEQDKILNNLRPKRSEECRMIYFRSMLQSKNKIPFLVGIKAVQPSFPMCGRLELKHQNFSIEFFKGNNCLIADSIAIQRNLKTGDKVQLGKLSLQIAGIIKKEPGQILGGVGFAPSIIIPIKKAHETGLIKFGSRVRYCRLIKFDPKQNSIESVNQWKEKAAENLNTPHIRITTFDDAQNNVRELLRRQSSFFLLVSIVALIIGVIGMGANITTFLNEQLENVGTLRCLGIGPSGIFHLYLSVCLLFGLAGGMLGGILGSIFSYASFEAMKSILSIESGIVLRLRWHYFIEGILVACIVTLVVNLHKVRSLSHLAPMDILRGKITRIAIDRIGTSITIITSLALLFIYMYIKSGDWRTAFFFELATVIMIFMVLLLIAIILKFIARFPTAITGSGRIAFTFRHGIRQLLRQKSRTYVFLVSLTVGFVLIQTLNMVYQSLALKISDTRGGSFANIFLVDIQKSQVEEITRLANIYSEAGIDFAPLVRARLTHINGKTIVQKDRRKLKGADRERYRWLVREQNLSYKDKLNKSETIIDGDFWKPGEREVKISLEQRFAKRTGLNLGDILRFDIQGRKLQGKVTSFRQIDWVSMQPNFFVVLPKIPLEEAPQIFIASLRITNPKKLAAFQRKVVKTCNNVSVVDAGKIIENVEKLLGYFSNALRITAWFCVLVGVLILLGTFSVGHKERLDQIALYRTLGCRKKEIILCELLEFLSIGLITAIITCPISLALAKTFAWLMEMDLNWQAKQIYETILMIFLPMMIGLIVNWKTYGAGVMDNLRREII